MWRNLRIGAAYLCFTLCVAVSTLWVHSYFSTAIVNGCFSTTTSFSALSIEGRIVLNCLGERDVPLTWKWENVFDFSWEAHMSMLGLPPDVWGFRLIGRSITVPHWFQVLLFASLAVSLKPAPRLRISLRELLIIVTIVAVVLGVLGTLLRLPSDVSASPAWAVVQDVVQDMARDCAM